MRKSMKVLVITLVASFAALAGVLMLGREGAVLAAGSQYTVSWRDEFNTDALDRRWSWVREDASYWSLTERPGYLRIATQDETLFEPVNSQKNLLLTDADALDFRLTTKVAFTPTANFQKAGLLIYQDDDNYLEVTRGRTFGSGVQLFREIGGTAEVITVSETATTTYLRVVKVGDVYTGYSSLDGSSWSTIGVYTASLDSPQVGVAATNSAMTPLPSIDADFDWFTFEGTCTRSDDFDGPSLDVPWSWVNEDSELWSLSERPGFLTITSTNAALDVSGSNLLIQPAPSEDYQIETHVYFTPTEDFQIAGLTAYQDAPNKLLLGRAYCRPENTACSGNAIYFDYSENGELRQGNFATVVGLQGEAYLRMTRHGNAYTGYYSGDGANWSLIGTHVVSEALSLDWVGLAAGQVQTTTIAAHFDSFRLCTYCRDVYLPLVLRLN
jgi:cytochrome c